MRKFKGKLIGVVPILFERLLEEAQEQIEERKNAPHMTRKEKIKQAHRKVYRQDGKMGLPAKNVKACFIQGSKMLQQKRGQARLWRYLEAAVFFMTDFLPFPQNEPDLIHEETGRIKKAPIQIFRPALREGWELPFEMVCYDDTIPESQIKEAFEYAGLMVGLGGHRPEFGRFRIEWEDGDDQGPA